ncbi:MAG TPA: hypothetical protein VHR43_17990 [Gemmatimonadales bacterium]|nr:hypothetical protein [Gemmatimonadales bacterium]
MAQDRPWLRLGGQVIGAYERADRIPGGRGLDEIRLVQPVLFLHAGGFHPGGLGRLELSGVLNFEGATIPNGELAPGNWGEGFVDRRHPHTYLHELVLTAGDLLGRHDGDGDLSLSAGKGFAPFGTDDPMVRPFVRYPVNHHLSQILERAVAIAAVRTGPVRAEIGLFNGDEPEHPGQWPRIGGRFGDSWSARLTGTLRPGATVQGSLAHVHSPEHRPGAGTDQHKLNLSARWQGRFGGHATYALAEWARTSEADGFFVFHSLLVEGAWSAGPQRLQYRFERTERPEEERLTRFRSLRPHLENSILGVTRWTVHTLGYGIQAFGRGRLLAEPLAEIGFARVTKMGGGIFEPAAFYGRDHIWTLTLGVRVTAGARMHRMGRYGAAEEEGMDVMTSGHGMQP